MQELYLDNSATTRVYDDVIGIMMDYHRNKYGNPSSLHRMGIEAEKGVKNARDILAKFLNVEEKEIIFTSGGTEGNNMAIMGVINRHRRKGKHIITSKIEHPSVLNVFKELEKADFEVNYLDVDDKGLIDLEQLEACIKNDTILVSIMMVNNEIGTIQPIQQIGKVIKKRNKDCIFHVDGVQALGKIHCNPKEMGIDLLTMSSHKLHGPKGVGALYIDNRIPIHPIIFGGEQETGLRSGTENVPGIVGFGKAIEIIGDHFEENMTYLYQLRETTRRRILEEIDHFRINGSDNDQEIAPHILSVSFKWIKGEVLLHFLEQDGIYVSTGSACSSKRKGSHVLSNVGLDDGYIDGTIRISFSVFNRENEIDYLLTSLKNHVERLRKIMRR